MKVAMTATGTTDLQHVLVDLGVEVTRAGEREISGKCPVHLSRTGHVDRSPSWSMNAETGLWICYSCGARGTLVGLISELTGDKTSIIDVHSFLINSSLQRLEREYLPEPEPEVDWLSYSRFSEVPLPYLYNRNLDASATRKHGVRWDVENKAWVIPIVSPMGDLMGWQSKKVDWVRNYPVGIKKSHTLFGIERFTAQTAVLVESPLDVVRMSTVLSDVQGLATFGAFVSTEQIKLLNSVASRVIVAMDNDEAGLKASKSLFKNLPRFDKGVLWLNYRDTNAKDIGDMTDEEIKNAVDTASAIPGWVL
jgi:5S rRNA maturation endonuclease (ribonuclease M5)